MPRSVDSLSLVNVDANPYSVPTKSARHPAIAVAPVDTARIVAGDRVAAAHRRCWGRERAFYEPAHYPALRGASPGRRTSRRPGG